MLLHFPSAFNHIYFFLTYIFYNFKDTFPTPLSSPGGVWMKGSKEQDERDSLKILGIHNSSILFEHWKDSTMLRGMYKTLISLH